MNYTGNEYRIPTHAVNPETGEVEPIQVKTSFMKTEKQIISEASSRSARKKKTSPYAAWHVTNTTDDSMYLMFLGDKSLTPTDKYIWSGYASFIKLGNWVCTQQKMIANRIGVDVSTISLATKRLVSAGYLERKAGSACEYRIPKSMAYCGSWKLFNIDD